MTSPLDATSQKGTRSVSREQVGAFEGLSRISMPVAEAADLLRRRLDGFQTQSFLSYALIGSGVSIWVADNRGMRFHVAEADTREIMRCAQNLFALCATPDSDLRAIRDASRFLYGALVEPIEYLFDAGRTIITHFASDFPCVPFALLLNGKREYFGDRFRFQVASRFPESAPVPTSATATRLARALVVDTTFDRDASSPADRRASDLQLLGKLGSEHNLLDAATANAALFSALAPDADLLFLRAQWTTTSRGPAIVLDRHLDSVPQFESLPESKVIYLHEASSQWLDRCQLAILDHPTWHPHAAAEATVANETDLYGLGALARALHGVGVSNVLMPLWPSTQESRATLLRALASHMHLGMPVADAARKAARDVRNQPYWQHPHHWGAFQLCSIDGVP